MATVLGVANPVVPEGRVLGHLADLETQRPAVVEHPAPVALEPGQDRPGELRGVAVIPGVGGRAHAVVEDALGRRLGEIQGSFVQEPVLVRDAEGLELLVERSGPLLVFVDDVDVGHGGNTPLDKDPAGFLTEKGGSKEGNAAAARSGETTARSPATQATAAGSAHGRGLAGRHADNLATKGRKVKAPGVKERWGGGSRSWSVGAP